MEGFAHGRRDREVWAHRELLKSAPAVDPRGAASAGEIAARIERLPFSRWHRRRLAIIGIAHFFDAFDALTIAFVMPVLAREWNLTAPQIGLAIALGYVGQAIGAIGFGAAAEHFGRRRVLRWTLTIIALFSLASAFAGSFLIFVLCRLIQGLGLGGEVPVAATYINEFCPGRTRGRIVLALQVLFATGVLVSSVAAVWVIPHWGWRAMFLIGSLPLLLAILLPWLVPESARWLAESGRTGEAEAIVAGMEAEIEKGGTPLPLVRWFPNEGPPNPATRYRWTDLLQASLRPRTLILWTMALCASIAGYGILSWMPTVYSSVYGLPLEEALAFGLAINFGAFVGNTLALGLIDLIGRRWTFSLGYFGGGLSLLLLTLAGTSASPEAVMAFSVIAMLFLAMPLSCLYVYAPELYPTQIRAIGAGAASSWLRIGSIVGPIAVGFMLPNLGLHAVFGFFCFACGVGCLAVILGGIETKGRSLEAISGAHAASQN